MRRILQDGRHNSLANGCWNWIFNPSLNDTGSSSMCYRENVAKVKIVGEHEEPLFSGEGHDFRIESFWIADLGPMNALHLTSGEELDPFGSQVHVDQDFHFDESGTSNSSARHAAYASASVMSSFSRYG